MWAAVYIFILSIKNYLFYNSESYYNYQELLIYWLKITIKHSSEVLQILTNKSIQNKSIKDKRIINIILGYTIKFIHYILIRIIIAYVLFFSYSFILNIIILTLLILTLYSWYILNCCIFTLSEKYLLDEKKFNVNEIILKNYTKINLFDNEIIIFNDVLESYQTYISIFLIIVFLIKITYIHYFDKK